MPAPGRGFSVRRFGAPYIGNKVGLWDQRADDARGLMINRAADRFAGPFNYWNADASKSIASDAYEFRVVQELIMNALISLLIIVLLATSLVAQDAPIPQDLPSQLRKTSDAVRRRVEQPIPPGLPLQGPTNSLLNRLRATNRKPLATEGRANALPVEDRIVALEAKVEALQREVETQKAVIKQLKEILDQQQKN